MMSGSGASCGAGVSADMKCSGSVAVVCAPQGCYGGV